jgi:hypothetical protein
VPVCVNDGFIKAFSPEFLIRYGRISLFVRAVSDLWTSALVRMLKEKDPQGEIGQVVMLADPAAVEVIRRLVAMPALKEPFFQESMGFVKVGAIEMAFNAAFGPQAFARWLVAFEGGEYRVCEAITQRST